LSLLSALNPIAQPSVARQLRPPVLSLLSVSNRWKPNSIFIHRKKAQNSQKNIPIKRQLRPPVLSLLSVSSPLEIPSIGGVASGRGGFSLPILGTPTSFS
jgi:hypothetical protein